MTPPNSNHWKTDPEYIDLLNYLIERAKNAESPMSIRGMAIEFKEKSGSPQLVNCLWARIKRARTIIHSFEHIDTNTKVKVLFALSAPVHPKFMNELSKNGLVIVDRKNLITHYKANDGSFELRRTKLKNAESESQRRLRSLIIDYFDKKNDSDAIPKNEEVMEIWNLIEFITEKCENVNSPLNVCQSAKDFIEHFGISRPLTTIKLRIRTYGREIQKIESLDTLTKVKQLFCLSQTLDSNFLEELQKDAVVEVDNMNRITKYAANDGSLTLHGDHSHSAKGKLGWIASKINKKAVEKQCSYGGDEGSDEYSSEESKSESDSDDENDHLNETEESSSSFSKPTEHFNLPTERSHRSGEIETREDDRRKRNNSSSTAPTSEKKRIKGTTGFSSAKPTESYSNSSIRPNELDDYDTNFSMVDQVKLEPFRGSIQEDLNEIKKEDDIQQIPKPFPALDEHNPIEDVWIKIEQEEPVEDSTEPIEAKPETSHNPKIEFFKALKSLIRLLDSPSLSKIQLEIRLRIRSIGGSQEVIQNNKIVVIIELLISRMAYHSVTNLSENTESVNLSNFLCYLKAAIKNSKMRGMKGLVKNITKLIEESQNKRIPMERVANALGATLDTYRF